MDATTSNKASLGSSFDRMSNLRRGTLGTVSGVFYDLIIGTVASATATAFRAP